LFQWRVTPSSEEELKAAQVIIGLTGPGSEETKARIVDELRLEYGIPCIVQSHLAPYLSIENDMVVGGQEGAYVDTFAVLSQVREIWRDNGWEKAIIVAHPDHLWRCLKVAEKLGFEVCSPKIDIPYDRNKEGSPFVHNHQLTFRPREIGARFRELLKGRM